jgi:S-DNA-T family DNA segregation ATPase FtsK/SpoIIIE
MICVQCKSEVVDPNTICPNCGAVLAKSGENSTELVQNVSGGVTLSAGEQANIHGDAVGHDKIEVKNDYSVTNTIYQFNLVSDSNEQASRDNNLEKDRNSAPTPNIHSQIGAQRQSRLTSPKSSLPKITSPIRASTDQIWRLPSNDAIFGPPDRTSHALDKDDLTEYIRLIEMVLSINDAPAKVVSVEAGPTVTCYGFEPGFREEEEVIDLARDIRIIRRLKTQVDVIKSLQSQIAAHLGLPVRIISSSSGKSYIGIEVPNRHCDAVTLKKILRTSNYAKAHGQLRIAIGEDSSNSAAIVDNLENMRHLSIMGTPGSGKSTCIRTILSTLLMRYTPNDLQILMIDPDGTHFHEYSNLPHLLMPVVSNKYLAVEVFEKMLVEMEARYDGFEDAKARTVIEYDSVIAKDNKCLPYLIIIVENLSSLVEVDPESVERMLIELTEKGHTVGMHLIATTQSPLNAETIRLIRYCFPVNYVFLLNSTEESVSILGQSGAECLLEHGDMLISHRADLSDPQRVQVATVAFDELTLLLNYWKIQAEQMNDQTSRQQDHLDRR